MANPAHVAIVQQGLEALNAWHAAHPNERLDLEKADLAGLNLCGANLQGAKLHGAHLQEANLAEANLQHAGLREAHLVGANLSGARLQHARLVKANLEQASLPWARLQKAHLHGAYLPAASLRQANLQGAYLLWAYLVGACLDGVYAERADLQWANLQEVSLAGASLQEADLQESVLGHTAFDHTNLHGARGLATCRHQRASSLDLGTLARSGHLPESFLRGCGWSAERLVNIAGLLKEPAACHAIERSLAFPPLYQQAGLGLLTYFGTILHQRHPDIPATVRLLQDGRRVRLLLEPAAAHRDTVEQTLQAYGLVVAGRKAPDELLGHPSHVQQLQQQLVIADMTLRLTADTKPQTAPAQQPLPVAEALHRLRQLVGNLLADL
jgi:uncharacterized protein YjbI with pentapeptide repeats